MGKSPPLEPSLRALCQLLDLGRGPAHPAPDHFQVPAMACSMLLKSCAMPPVSWPTASIFCDWRSCLGPSRPAPLVQGIHVDEVGGPVGDAGFECPAASRASVMSTAQLV